MTGKERAEAEEEKLYIYSGILYHNQEFEQGDEKEITYAFDSPELQELKNRYELESIAGKGGDFEKAKRLMHHFAPRLFHSSWYDNHIELNSLKLLEYSLDDPQQGINCFSKSKILQEMCLSLGIHARRVFIMPYSPYDFDNHVVVEIFDRRRKKWIMLDPSMDSYVIDENKIPLSLLEMRAKFANDEFVTWVKTGESLADPEKLRWKHMQENTYYCKNLFYFEVDRNNGFGRSAEYLTFCPAGFSCKRRNLGNAKFRLNHLPEEYEEMRPVLEKRLAEAEQSEEEIKTGIEAMLRAPVAE